MKKYTLYINYESWKIKTKKILEKDLDNEIEKFWDLASKMFENEDNKNVDKMVYLCIKDDSTNQNEVKASLSDNWYIQYKK